ncbi:MAG: Gfo/Idh/MocA family oxidoreductase [Armatimonadetes bacterium]|nr:Gfo/Idh/MocA family oxidoreductase [Armatimonadota bacterium]
MSIKCAVVGYGPAHSMGAHHCGQIRNTEGLELVAVADVDPERAKLAGEQEGVRAYSSLTELLEKSEAELVTLVTPHDTHAPLAIEALQAGRHVITEKVMCLNTDEADRMIEAARAAGRMLSVYQNRRWDTDYVTVRSVIEAGLLGQVFDIESAVGGYGRPRGWRGEKKHGGGMLYDWGAHLVDQVVQMVPSQPVRVFATMQHRVWDVDVETHASVHITFADGCVAHVDVGCISWIPRHRWLVRGEAGALFKQTLGDDSKVQVSTSIDSLSSRIEVDPVPASWGSYYENIAAHLLRGEELIVKPEQVRTAVAVIEAAFKSAQTGEAVAVS